MDSDLKNVNISDFLVQELLLAASSFQTFDIALILFKKFIAARVELGVSLIESR